MWYVLQTMTGKEEELVCMIRKIVSREVYEDCFVAYYERIWRREGRSIVHVERLFPGYVFVITQKPEELFLQLKRVPALSKMMADAEFTFIALEEKEEAFLGDMLKDDRVVRLSYVETDGRGRILYVSDPLKKYLPQLVRVQFKKRYAIIRLTVLGEEKTVLLGIILKEDVRQELAFGKVESPLKMPETYQIPLGDRPHEFSVGDHIIVNSGPFQGMTGRICRMKKSTVGIGVHLFGQEMEMEMPIDVISRTSDNGGYEK